MNTKGIFSHKSDEWQTPKAIYNKFMKMGYFDPCPINHDQDGLKIEWKENNFVNPPYSQISKWVDKAIKENKKGKNVMLLVPAITDTKWFKKLYEYGCNFYFITGRLKFNDGKQSAPFPSVMINLVGKSLNLLLLIGNAV